jgi:putative SOS response-associated peptidase YedK
VLADFGPRLERSTAVIGTDANEVVEKMHDRMPVIIQAKDYDRRLTADPNRSPIDRLVTRTPLFAMGITWKTSLPTRPAGL